MDININKFKNRSSKDEFSKFINSRYYDTSMIVETIEKCVTNIENNEKSFVIYGEPQSGKTDMMIGLTAKLVDIGFSCIVILVQNNLTLEQQNRDRFLRSGISPKPQHFSTVLDSDYDLSKKNIIFCTKEHNNLLKLQKRLSRIKNKVFLDDEADHSTPDSNVNDPEKDATTTNRLIKDLVGEDSIYIGVTATPARLDLNNTLSTNAKSWVYFAPHEFYSGYRFFFPKDLISNKKNPDYDLDFLPPEPPNENVELRKTFFKFLINASYLNKHFNKENYLMLIHTTHKMVEHAEEFKDLNKIIDILNDQEHQKWDIYIKEIYEIGIKKFQEESIVDNIIHFILDNRNEIDVSILNTEGKSKISNMSGVTSEPSRIFTVVIGGNIISRGLTFGNLLSMYFARGS